MGQELPATLELVHAAQGGDRRALEQLFERYYDRVRRIVRARMGPRVRRWTDSVDILTRTLCKAEQKLAEFTPRDDGSLLRWLAAIAEGMVRDALAERDAACRSPDREVPIADVDGDGDGDGAGSVVSQLADHEEHARVDAAIAALPEPDRELLVRHYFLGMAWEEVASELGDSAAAVRQRACVARARLAIELLRLRAGPA